MGWESFLTNVAFAILQTFCGFMLGRSVYRREAQQLSEAEAAQKGFYAVIKALQEGARVEGTLQKVEPTPDGPLTKTYKCRLYGDFEEIEDEEDE